MSRPTLEKVSTIVQSLGTVLCPKTKNKGAAGILCETLTGIPNSSAHLDCVDGEVKVFPLKRTRAGTLIPKETIAVTMVNPTSLTTQETFAGSTCCSKMKRVLYVPYLRETDETIQFFQPTMVSMSEEMYSTLANDYNAIRSKFIEDGTFTSSLGVYIQTRTKGPGKNAPKTRAFYLKKEFIDAYITKTW